ncbi:50S ribosomal protein L9 [Mycoplasma zalophi]|uniref:Large ribosomal subunit protein bL9 n=1 Tax=Mycoplasma zalophi TaxID=191287 RepID=A0ABS6DNX5_9MOLU|nr:50S ribosomal protein L9 [Mycoplasma zalophi]MBU4691200.1 50S ribosomal protein L9 [Mycoplasma zalophi]MBU4692025.1 50S ribosomal protein L9 [Mycoplasma zalophi]
MKVILIKDFKKNKKNEIIEVNDGFAKNYLIRNGIAQPVNSSTLANRKKILDSLAENEAQRIAEAEALKAEIEKIELNFELKVHTEKNGINIVHGSITSKAITKELLTKHNIKLPNHSIDKVSITTLGIHGIPVILHPSVTAFLKVRIHESK